MNHPVCELCQEWLLVRFASTSNEEADCYIKAVRDMGSMFEEHMGVPCALHPNAPRIDGADAALVRLIGLTEFLLRSKLVVTFINDDNLQVNISRTLKIKDTANREYEYLRRK